MNKLNHTKYKKQQGFGLLEVLITALIVGLGIAALTSLQGTLIKTNAVSKDHEIAMRLAQSQIDGFRSYVSIEQFRDIISSENDSNIETNNQNFALSWQVTDHPDNNSKYIEVMVEWTDVNNTSKRFILPTVIALTLT